VLTLGIIQPSSERGGIEIGLLNWGRHLDPAEFRRIVYLPKDGPIIPHYEAAGIETRIVPMRQLRTSASALYQAGYLAAFLPTVVRLARVMARDRVDIVHSNSLYSLYGSLAAWLIGRPMVWHVHEVPDQAPVLVIALTEWVARSATRVVTISPAVTRVFRPRWAQQGRVQEVTEGIDLDRFKPPGGRARLRRELGLTEGQVLVTWAARLDPWKGAEVFIRAAAEVSGSNPDVRFLMCGGELPGYPEYASTIRSLAAESGLADRLTLAGWRYSWMDMPGVMAATDIFVHTPVATEPLGMVILEAMALCRPVVAPSAGGPATIVVDGETGVLVPPGDVSAFAAAIQQLAANPQLRAGMGRAGRKRVEALYDSRGYGERMADLYRGLLAGPQGAPSL
jgi:glycosyltransferase involved in cell wall biosynthesis